MLDIQFYLLCHSASLTPDTRPLTPDTRPLTPDTRPLTPDTRPLTPDIRLLPLPYTPGTYPLPKDAFMGFRNPSPNGIHDVVPPSTIRV